METKSTRKAVTKAKIQVGNIFRFKKLPICPPIKTAANKYQKFGTSAKTAFFDNCPGCPTCPGYF